MDETNKSDVENNLSSDDLNQLNQNNNEPDNANTVPIIGDDVTKQQQEQQQQQQQPQSPPSLPATNTIAEQTSEQNPSDASTAINHTADVVDNDGTGNTAASDSSPLSEPSNNGSSAVTKCDSDAHLTSDAPTTTTTTENSVSEVTEMEHEPIEQPVISTQDEPPDGPDPPDEQRKNEIETDAAVDATTEIEASVSVASPKSHPSEPNTNSSVVNDENSKSAEHHPSPNNANDDENNESNQMSQIDNSEDLLVPTDYVPDSADVIGDDSKRRHSQSDEASEEPFKKFKHDTVSDDDDVSMADSLDALNEMCTDSDINDQPVAAIAAAAAAAAEAATAAAAAEAAATKSIEKNEMDTKMATSTNDEPLPPPPPPPSSSSPSISPQPPPTSLPLSLSPSQSSMEPPCETASTTTTAKDDELNIADIFSSKGLVEEKTLSLVDIIDNADDLISKDTDRSESNSDDLLQKSSKPSGEQCSDDVVDNGAGAASTVADDIASAVETSASSSPGTGKEATPSDELNFDISEKLKEMGEISVAPVSKTATSERKPSLADFDLGDEVSLEQIKKSTGTGDSDDKRNKVSNLRKNIREVMDDNQLDASTLAAQREELERLARVQEQQRMIREMQRQVALDRQNSKTQNKVLSLLTGHTSLLKSSSTASTSSSSSAPVTTTSGAAAAAAAAAAGEIGSINSGTDVDDIFGGKSGNLTPSVSIAPIKPSQKKSAEPIDAASDIASKSIEPCEIDLDADEKFSQLDKSDDNDLMIVDEDSEEEDEDDDDVVELKAKRDIVEIEDSSDDDCIM